jgi:2,5-diamino-6-(ribosylamino)-4(3H)-pyrimidinone 5'-phosphate reductase
MDRPKVIVKNSASLDGKLAVSADRPLLYGDERWDAIDAPRNMDVFDWLKSVHQATATLEGSGSFLPENETPPLLPAFTGDAASLYEDYLPEEVVRRPGHKGWFTVVDGRGRVRWLYKEYPDPAWAGWYALVLACRATPPEYLAYLRRELIPYLVAGEERVDLAGALEKMAARLGVASLISTAGGKLNGALLRQGLVDEIDLEFLPAVIGAADAPSLFSVPPLIPGEMPIRLKLLSVQVQGNGRLWVRYEVIQQG